MGHMDSNSALSLKWIIWAWNQTYGLGRIYSIIWDDPHWIVLGYRDVDLLSDIWLDKLCVDMRLDWDMWICGLMAGRTTVQEERGIAHCCPTAAAASVGFIMKYLLDQYLLNINIALLSNWLHPLSPPQCLILTPKIFTMSHSYNQNHPQCLTFTT